MDQSENASYFLFYNQYSFLVSSPLDTVLLQLQELNGRMFFSFNNCRNILAFYIPYY